MGLLDDAIREHLDLKRRRGADPGEVERQEEEALGPPRTEAAFADVEAEADPGDAPAAVAAGSSEGPTIVHPTEPPEEEPWLEDEPLEPPTTEFATPEEEGAEEPEPPRSESDDVLEETPEFLQETPEHDRLWFEQRPPRDFDFDK